MKQPFDKLLLLLAIVIVSCGDGESLSSPSPESTRPSSPSLEPTQPSEPYNITISASAVGSDRLVVSGETNLPTGSVLHMLATRSFLDRGAEEVRAVLLGSIDVELTASQFDAMLILDESDMVVVAGAPDVVETVSDRVTVCVQFQTGISAFDEEQRQPDPDVVDIVGEYGEELSDSPDVYVFGSATANPANWLEEQAIVRIQPLELDAIADAQDTRPSVDKLEGFCL